MVVPDQMWLDGINSGKKGIIKQFVAMPLGMGYTVEGQVTGEEIHGGLQLCVFEPKSGRFPDAEPQYDHLRHRRGGAAFYSGTAFKGGSSLMASCNVGHSMLRGDTHGLSASTRRPRRRCQPRARVCPPCKLRIMAEGDRRKNP